MDGLGSGGQEITTTQTNPKVPKDFEGVANMLRLLASGMLSNPTNFGPTGLDAPAAKPLVPQPSMGNLFASNPYQMGANRIRIGGSGRMQRPARMQATRPMPTSWGDLFTQKPTSSSQANKPFMDDQKRLASMAA